MRKHQIPPNFDTSKIFLFGLISISALIEAAVASGLFYFIFNNITQILENSFPVQIAVSALSLILFIIVFLSSSQEPVYQRMIKRFFYLKGRKKLRMRRVRARIDPIAKAEADEFDDSVEPLPYSLSDKIRKKFLLRENIFERELLKRKGPDYTQEILDITDIDQDTGVVSLKDGRFLKIYEIRAANFFALSEGEQDAILSDYARFLKIGPLYFQIKVLTDHADLSDYTRVKRNETKNNNEALEKLRYEVEAQVSSNTETSVLDHRYYLIISVVPDTLEKGEEARQAYYHLKVCDEIIRTRIGKRGVRALFLKDRDQERSEQLNACSRFFYRFYNRKSSGDESYTDRAERVQSDLKLFGELTGESRSNRIRHFIAPRGIDLSHPDFLIMDGLYYTYLVITRFPQRGIPTGFLSRFINVGAGFDFDLLVERVPKHEIQKKLSRRNILTKANADQMQQASVKALETNRIIHSTESMIQALEDDNEFFYICPVITISAETHDELERKRDWIKRHLESYNLGTTEPVYEMEEAFRITEPIARWCPDFFERYRRNILTDGMTGLYPFITASTLDEDGILLGTDLNNHSPVILDLFDPLSNVFLFGMTGYGKSFLSMLIATRLRLRNTQVYVLSPLKGHEYYRITEAVGGSFIEIGPGSKDCINILEVRPVLGNEEEGHEISYLNEKIQRIIKFFTLITEDTLNRVQKDRLSPFLVHFYQQYGITDDNDSIFEDKDRTKLVKMPVLGDLKEALERSEDPDLKILSISLEKFTEGNLSYLDHDTNVELDNAFCCIDIGRALDYPETRNLVLFIVMDYLWSKIRSDRKSRKAIIFEELWKMLLNQETAEIVQEVFKTIRGYYGIAIANTQNLSDLDRFQVGDGILNNTVMQCFLHCSPNEAEKLREYFKLSQHEYADITGADKGQCLIVSPTRRHFLKVQATSVESVLFETDGNRLNREEVEYQKEKTSTI